MTDFALKFANKPTFDAITRAIYESMSGVKLEKDQPTPRQGRSLTGTEWFVDEIGLFYEPTGETVDSPMGPLPVMKARTGWHANLRWNGGDDPPPDNIPGMEVVWRSDAVDEEGNSIPRPDWWTRIIG
jgi:hypothetical protein